MSGIISLLNDTHIRNNVNFLKGFALKAECQLVKLTKQLFLYQISVSNNSEKTKVISHLLFPNH